MMINMEYHIKLGSVGTTVVTGIVNGKIYGHVRYLQVFIHGPGLGVSSDAGKILTSGNIYFGSDNITNIL